MPGKYWKPNRVRQRAVDWRVPLEGALALIILIVFVSRL